MENSWASFVPMEARRKPDAVELSALRVTTSIRPRIVSALVRGPICIRLGETFDIDVEVRGIPTPSVDFFDGRHALQEDADRFVIKRKRYIHTLTVVRAQYDLNDLNLHVTASNKAGSDRVKLDVKIYRVLPGDSTARRRARSETWRTPESVLVTRRRKVRVIRRGQSLCSLGSVNSFPSTSRYQSDLSSSTASGIFYSEHHHEANSPQNVVFDEDVNTSYTIAENDQETNTTHQKSDVFTPSVKRHTHPARAQSSNIQFSSKDNEFREVSSTEYQTSPPRKTKVRFASVPELHHPSEPRVALRRPRARRSRSAPGRRGRTRVATVTMDDMMSMEQSAIVQGKAKSMEMLQHVSEVKQRKKRSKSGAKIDGQQSTGAGASEVTVGTMDVDLSSIGMTTDEVGASAPGVVDVKRRKKKTVDRNMLDVSVASAPEGMMYMTNEDTSHLAIEAAGKIPTKTKKKTRTKSSEKNVTSTVLHEDVVTNVTEHMGDVSIGAAQAANGTDSMEDTTKKPKKRTKSSERSSHKGHSPHGRRHHGHEWYSTDYTTQQPEMKFYGFIDEGPTGDFVQDPSAAAEPQLVESSTVSPAHESLQSSPQDENTSDTLKKKKKKTKTSTLSSRNTTLDDEPLDVSIENHLEAANTTNIDQTASTIDSETNKTKKPKKKRSKSTDSLSSMTKADKLELSEKNILINHNEPVQETAESNSPKSKKPKKKRSKSSDSLLSLTKTKKTEKTEETEVDHIYASSVIQDEIVLKNQNEPVQETTESDSPKSKKPKKKRSKSSDSLLSLTKTTKTENAEETEVDHINVSSVIQDENCMDTPTEMQNDVVPTDLQSPKVPKPKKSKHKRTKSTDSLSSMTKAEKIELSETLEIATVASVLKHRDNLEGEETSKSKHKKKRSKSQESLSSRKSEKLKSQIENNEIMSTSDKNESRLSPTATVDDEHQVTHNLEVHVPFGMPLENEVHMLEPDTKERKAKKVKNKRSKSANVSIASESMLEIEDESDIKRPRHDDIILDNTLENLLPETDVPMTETPQSTEESPDAKIAKTKKSKKKDSLSQSTDTLDDSDSRRSTKKKKRSKSRDTSVDNLLIPPEMTVDNSIYQDGDPNIMNHISTNIEYNTSLDPETKSPASKQKKKKSKSGNTSVEDIIGTAPPVETINESVFDQFANSPNVDGFHNMPTSNEVVQQAPFEIIETDLDMALKPTLDFPEENKETTKSKKKKKSKSKNTSLDDILVSTEFDPNPMGQYITPLEEENIYDMPNKETMMEHQPFEITKSKLDTMQPAGSVASNTTTPKTTKKKRSKSKNTSLDDILVPLQSPSFEPAIDNSVFHQIMPRPEEENIYDMPQEDTMLEQQQFQNTQNEPQIIQPTSSTTAKSKKKKRSKSKDTSLDDILVPPQTTGSVSTAIDNYMLDKFVPAPNEENVYDMPQEEAMLEHQGVDTQSISQSNMFETNVDDNLSFSPSVETDSIPSGHVYVTDLDDPSGTQIHTLSNDNSFITETNLDDIITNFDHGGSFMEPGVPYSTFAELTPSRETNIDDLKPFDTPMEYTTSHRESYKDAGEPYATYTDLSQPGGPGQYETDLDQITYLTQDLPPPPDSWMQVQADIHASADSINDNHVPVYAVVNKKYKSDQVTEPVITDPSTTHPPKTKRSKKKKTNERENNETLENQEHLFDHDRDNIFTDDVITIEKPKKKKSQKTSKKMSKSMGNIVDHSLQVSAGAEEDARTKSLSTDVLETGEDRHDIVLDSMQGDTEHKKKMKDKAKKKTKKRLSKSTGNIHGKDDVPDEWTQPLPIYDDSTFDIKPCPDENDNQIPIIDITSTQTTDSGHINLNEVKVENKKNKVEKAKKSKKKKGISKSTGNIHRTGHNSMGELSETPSGPTDNTEIVQINIDDVHPFGNPDQNENTDHNDVNCGMDVLSINRYSTGQDSLASDDNRYSVQDISAVMDTGTDENQATSVIALLDDVNRNQETMADDTVKKKKLKKDKKVKKSVKKLSKSVDNILYKNELTLTSDPEPYEVDLIASQIDIEADNIPKVYTEYSDVPTSVQISEESVHASGESASTTPKDKRKDKIKKIKSKKRSKSTSNISSSTDLSIHSIPQSDDNLIEIQNMPVETNVDDLISIDNSNYQNSVMDHPSPNSEDAMIFQEQTIPIKKVKKEKTKKSKKSKSTGNLLDVPNTDIKPLTIIDIDIGEAELSKADAFVLPVDSNSVPYETTVVITDNLPNQFENIPNADAQSTNITDTEVDLNPVTHTKLVTLNDFWNPQEVETSQPDTTQTEIVNSELMPSEVCPHCDVTHDDPSEATHFVSKRDKRRKKSKSDAPIINKESYPNDENQVQDFFANDNNVTVIQAFEDNVPGSVEFHREEPLRKSKIKKSKTRTKSSKSKENINDEIHDPHGNIDSDIISSHQQDMNLTNDLSKPPKKKEKKMKVKKPKTKSVQSLPDESNMETSKGNGIVEPDLLHDDVTTPRIADVNPEYTIGVTKIKQQMDDSEKPPIITNGSGEALLLEELPVVITTVKEESEPAGKKPARKVSKSKGEKIRKKKKKKLNVDEPENGETLQPGDTNAMNDSDDDDMFRFIDTESVATADTLTDLDETLMMLEDEDLTPPQTPLLYRTKSVNLDIVLKRAKSTDTLKSTDTWKSVETLKDEPVFSPTTPTLPPVSPRLPPLTVPYVRWQPSKLAPRKYDSYRIPSRTSWSKSLPVDSKIVEPLRRWMKPLSLINEPLQPSSIKSDTTDDVFFDVKEPNKIDIMVTPEPTREEWILAKDAKLHASTGDLLSENDREMKSFGSMDFLHDNNKTESRLTANQRAKSVDWLSQKRTRTMRVFTHVKTTTIEEETIVEIVPPNQTLSAKNCIQTHASEELDQLPSETDTTKTTPTSHNIVETKNLTDTVIESEPVKEPLDVPSKIAPQTPTEITSTTTITIFTPASKDDSYILQEDTDSEEENDRPPSPPSEPPIEMESKSEIMDAVANLIPFMDDGENESEDDNTSEQVKDKDDSESTSSATLIGEADTDEVNVVPDLNDYDNIIQTNDIVEEVTVSHEIKENTFRDTQSSLSADVSPEDDVLHAEQDTDTKDNPCVEDVILEQSNDQLETREDDDIQNYLVVEDVTVSREDIQDKDIEKVEERATEYKKGIPSRNSHDSSADNMRWVPTEEKTPIDELARLVVDEAPDTVRVDEDTCSSHEDTIETTTVVTTTEITTTTKCTAISETETTMEQPNYNNIVQDNSEDVSSVLDKYDPERYPVDEDFDNDESDEDEYGGAVIRKIQFVKSNRSLLQMLDSIAEKHESEQQRQRTEQNPHPKPQEPAETTQPLSPELRTDTETESDSDTSLSSVIEVSPPKQGASLLDNDTGTTMIEDHIDRIEEETLTKHVSVEGNANITVEVMDYTVSEGHDFSNDSMGSSSDDTDDSSVTNSDSSDEAIISAHVIDDIWIGSPEKMDNSEELMQQLADYEENAVFHDVVPEVIPEEEEVDTSSNEDTEYHTTQDNSTATSEVSINDVTQFSSDNTHKENQTLTSEDVYIQAHLSSPSEDRSVDITSPLPNDFVSEAMVFDTYEMQHYKLAVRNIAQYGRYTASSDSRPWWYQYNTHSPTPVQYTEFVPIEKPTQVLEGGDFIGFTDSVRSPTTPEVFTCVDARRSPSPLRRTRSWERVTSPIYSEMIQSNDDVLSSSSPQIAGSEMDVILGGIPEVSEDVIQNGKTDDSFEDCNIPQRSVEEFQQNFTTSVDNSSNQSASNLSHNTSSMLPRQHLGHTFPRPSAHLTDHDKLFQHELAVNFASIVLILIAIVIFNLLNKFISSEDYWD